MALARSHVWVSGMVQGVNFRYSTREKALDAGVTGWVRNLRDGRVEAVFEGDEAAVAEVVEWCRQGPSGAWVQRLEERPETPSGEYSAFSVDRTPF